ncbi:hypothetical protein FUA23_12035 [Neolewinella aurantiaca]|uniref:MORN repeat protein n=1 Tax=Neolewinella aurantiaca TaxID=2602767 RepID=A0A5C7FNB7_9BACT|nr:hypothetical protein [Neolewinella aurantiaca]TXF89012.1 hypothetical protein FUA23_12035 [Neolewinella aurantiaca]
MLKSKATLPLLLALLGALGYIVFTHQEISQERARRLELTQDSIRLAERLVAYTSLATADSLFHAGRYAPAREAYQKLMADDSFSLFAVYLPERMAHAGRLLRRKQQPDTFQQRLLRPVAASAVELLPSVLPTPVSPLQPDASAYDSLGLLLRQAEGQVRDLRARLRQTTGANYLTFRSRENNEIYYVGEISEGKANGRGVALLSTGSRYEGEWKDNQKHGMGTFHWSDGARYEGEYENDKRSGEGSYYFPEGGVYAGGWKDDLRHGQGVFTNAKGKIVAQGIWRKDELVE